MNGTGLSTTDLSELHRQLRVWRRQQAGRARIPEEVWAAAADLARTQGVSRVARTLRLDYHKLRGRCAPRVAVAIFVELQLPESAVGCSTPFRVELAEARGARMTIELRQVRRAEGEGLFNQLLADHHYLGYTRPVGEHLKYLIRAGDRPVACMAWSSAPRHLAPRDRFIGWTKEERLRGLHCIAYNTRFLILPWVKVPHLASHLLGRVARWISADWQELYHHPTELLETFIDPGRFRGTCYRAANWFCLGRTTGRGHQDNTKRPNRPLKELWVYPLRPDFRTRLLRDDG